MSTPKFAPFIMLLQFLLSSAACYIVLLNHLEEYQQCISPLANALALVLGVPARFDLRSEHLVITILQQGGIRQFQLGALDWIYALQSSGAGLAASATIPWTNRVRIFIFACLIVGLIHALLLFFILVEYVYQTLGLFALLAFCGEWFYLLYAQGGLILLFLAWMYLCRRDLAHILTNLSRTSALPKPSPTTAEKDTLAIARRAPSPV